MELEEFLLEEQRGRLASSRFLVLALLAKHVHDAHYEVFGDYRKFDAGLEAGKQVQFQELQCVNRDAWTTPRMVRCDAGSRTTQALFDGAMFIGRLRIHANNCEFLPLISHGVVVMAVPIPSHIYRAQHQARQSPMSQQQQQSAPRKPALIVRDVWRENLEQEFALLRTLVSTHPVISFDVEFPGVVARAIPSPNANGMTTAGFLYNHVRCNVDVLQPIQLAFSLSTKSGLLPVVDGKEVAAWQFNFKFSLKEDMFNLESIQLLEHSGVRFEYLEQHGVFHHDFAELLISSGLVFAEDVTLIGFHSGFTAAYLLKLVSGLALLPTTLELFYEQLKLYVPVLYDLRLLVQKHAAGKWNLGGSLLDLAREFGVPPNTSEALHTAGVGAFLQLRTFLALPQQMVVPAYSGVLFGLEPRSTSPTAMLAAAGTGGVPPLALGEPSRHLKRRGTADIVGTT